jgi:CSLREA domain-containing protein
MRLFRTPLYRFILLAFTAILFGGQTGSSPALASPSQRQDAETALLSPAAALIQVTTTADDMTDNGNCTLREAIWAANFDKVRDKCTAGSGADTIVLPTGTFALTLPGTLENEGLKGDLDILTSMTIQGAGVGRTVIDGKGLDRVFHILGSGAEVYIQGVTIQGGSAKDGLLNMGGGGIMVGKGTLNLTNAALVSNSADIGGGIDNNGSLTLFYVTLENNKAVSKGGGIINTGHLYATNVTFSANQAGGTGGGINNHNSALLTNVTLTGNTAKNGGGIYNESSMTIFSSTIHQNVPGIGNTATMYIKNSIVSSIVGADNCFASDTSPIISSGYNIDSGSACKFSQTGDRSNLDPRLEPLANNGGRTLTHALLVDSPAVDSGDPDKNNCPATDQRGKIRPADGRDTGSAICDIGAYEFNALDAPQIFLPVLIKR